MTFGKEMIRDWKEIGAPHLRRNGMTVIGAWSRQTINLSIVAVGLLMMTTQLLGMIS